MSTIYNADTEALVGFYGQDQALERNGTATAGIGVSSHEGTYVVTGVKTTNASQTWRCKLDGTMVRNATTTGYQSWSQDIYFTGGHTYRIYVDASKNMPTIPSRTYCGVSLYTSSVVGRHYFYDGAHGEFDFLPSADVAGMLFLFQSNGIEFNGFTFSVKIRDLTAAQNYAFAVTPAPPIFYDENETDFTTRGIGPCSEATRCEVREELNGKYDLTLEMPATARHFTEVGTRTIILAKPNPYDNPQPFRICRPVMNSKMNVTYDANHISYDLEGYPVIPFTAANAPQAVVAMNDNQVVASQPFTFATDMKTENVGTMKVEEPKDSRSLLGIGENTLIGTYGGTLQYDKFNVFLMTDRGENRGYVIAYGKNVIDLEQEQNIADVYNAVFPFAKWKDGVYTGNVEMAPSTVPWAYYRVKAVDLSSKFQNSAVAPTAQALSNYALEWMYINKPWEPRVSLKITTVPPGSEGLQSLQDLRLGDTVKVRFLQLGIDVPTTVVAYTYDVLRGRYISIELGDKPRSAAEAIADASRLAKGTIAPERIGGGSIGAGKLTPDVQGKLATMVTTPYDGTFETTGFKFDHSQCTWVHLVGDNINAWVIGSYNAPDD